VIAFLEEASTQGAPVYLSAVTIGELRRGIELIRHRGDIDQAERLERWLNTVTSDHEYCVLPIDADTAQVWGRLRAPHPEHELDKQIAATALVNGLTVVTRNVGHFRDTGVRVVNPFT
jgi:predicted nucleic acid-binding protein